MSLIRWNPLLSRSLNQWPDIWDDEMMNSVLSSPSTNLDVYETDNDVVIRANVAGVTQKDIDITFEKGILWIKAERVEEKEEKQKKHYSKSSWDYSYKVAVPGMLDYNKEPSVTLSEGMLIITFKKAEASKPKKLTISS